MVDKFIDIELNLKNLDHFCIRKSIFESIQANLNEFRGRLLDIGCGQMPYRKFIQSSGLITEYIGIDVDSHLDYNGIKPDISWNDSDKMPIAAESFNCALLTEVLEHVPNPENLLSEIFRVLLPDGFFFFTIPFFWPLHEVPHDEYRYTPFSLERICRKQGFSDISIFPLGGWDASLAQMLGLWARRNPRLKKKRKIFSILLKPVIRKLIQKDRKSSEYRNNTMVTGWYGIVRKNPSQ